MNKIYIQIKFKILYKTETLYLRIRKKNSQEEMK